MNTKSLIQKIYGEHKFSAQMRTQKDLFGWQTTDINNYNNISNNFENALLAPSPLCQFMLNKALLTIKQEAQINQMEDNNNRQTTKTTTKIKQKRKTNTQLQQANDLNTTQDDNDILLDNYNGDFSHFFLP
eukprot:UN03675